MYIIVKYKSSHNPHLQPSHSATVLERSVFLGLSQDFVRTLSKFSYNIMVGTGFSKNIHLIAKFLSVRSTGYFPSTFSLVDGLLVTQYMLGYIRPLTVITYLNTWILISGTLISMVSSWNHLKSTSAMYLCASLSEYDSSLPSCGCKPTSRLLCSLFDPPPSLMS